MRTVRPSLASSATHSGVLAFSTLSVVSLLLVPFAALRERAVPVALVFALSLLALVPILFLVVFLPALTIAVLRLLVFCHVSLRP